MKQSGKIEDSIHTEKFKGKFPSLNQLSTPIPKLSPMTELVFAVIVLILLFAYLTVASLLHPVIASSVSTGFAIVGSAIFLYGLLIRSPTLMVTGVILSTHSASHLSGTSGAALSGVSLIVSAHYI